MREAHVRKELLELATQPFLPSTPMSTFCDDDCFCRPGSRKAGGSLLSQYKKGIFTARTRAANANYMREYRERKARESS